MSQVFLEHFEGSFLKKKSWSWGVSDPPPTTKDLELGGVNPPPTTKDLELGGVDPPPRRTMCSLGAPPRKLRVPARFDTWELTLPEPEPEGGGVSKVGELDPALKTTSAAIYCAFGREALDAQQGSCETEPDKNAVSGPEFVAMFARFQRVRRTDDNELACDEIWDHYECFSSCQAWYDRLCHVKQAKTVYDQIAALVFTGHRDESTVAPEGKGKGGLRQGRGGRGA